MRFFSVLLTAVLILGVALGAEAARAKKIKTDAKSDKDAVPGMLPYKALEVQAYNAGVDALEKRDFAQARKNFEAALNLNEKFPEAHSNLAYALRMQSLDNAGDSLAHYNRAIELAPKFAQAHYYRGILFVQLDRASDAQSACAELESLGTEESKNFAAELAKIIESGKAKKNQDALSIYGSIAAK